MKQPSMLSSRLIPAANRIGSVRIAYQGSANAAAPPASTSSPTSVAVSKPSPNSSPTGYMCQDLRTAFVAPPRIRFMNPRFFRCSSRAASSEDLEDSQQDHQVEDPDDEQEGSRYCGAHQPGNRVQRRRVVADLPGQGTY